MGGYKFDIRLYVLVTSPTPLQAYVYDRGLVRFSTEKYDVRDLTNSFAHLTNASLNKHSTTLGDDKDTIGQFSDWLAVYLVRVFYLLRLCLFVLFRYE